MNGYPTFAGAVQLSLVHDHAAELRAEADAQRLATRHGTAESADGGQSQDRRLGDGPLTSALREAFGRPAEGLAGARTHLPKSTSRS